MGGWTPTSPAVILARHGRTRLNAEGRLRGHLDPPLDQIGAEEARRLSGQVAPLLTDHLPHRILASPLLRTIQTAQQIARGVGLAVTVEERLIDRDFGAWAGARAKDVTARWGSIDRPGDA